MKASYIPVIAAAMLMTACKPTIKGIVPANGEANFASYVSLGNSLTAGYADGSLYRSGQESSYPAMLAKQFLTVGGGEFRQPLLPGNAGWPARKRVLGYTTGCDGVTGMGVTLFSGAADTTGSSTNISGQGPFNNLGVPGIRCIDYTLSGYAVIAQALAGVGYAARMYPRPSTDRPIDIAAASNPTFFSIWLGGNDVLGYASNGGEGNGLGTGTLPNDISPTSAFDATYNAVVDVMTAKGAKGILINIPDVTTIPFFTTIPPRGLVLARKGQADSLTAAYSPLGIKFTVGANPFIIQDPAAPGGLRQIKDNEYLLLTLPQDSLKCGGWGSIKPIPKKYVLDQIEVGNVRTATNAFNSIIRDAATRKGLGYVDAQSFLTTLQSGITFNGVRFTPTFVSGGAFSLDGIHLSPRGYALMANEIIRVINSTYKSSVPQIDANAYRGVLFP
ncbi:hypothetical protein DBR32_03050 [Taibaiella sp. KBW10]|uniref:SGNH/GDSL hydrolase family protein n=1 Tax=Taibaiella sp. KBW10 TaxID=2153357 RepID=UPI000F5A5D13|nr:SGNH/GDSL hydrolase family protein [Taibaiella sp. KBW10]RQO32587.1 hypothetical protein DBR32_03050 [Taibaiella sp. KBW10]